MRKMLSYQFGLEHDFSFIPIHTPQRREYDNLLEDLNKLKVKSVLTEHYTTLKFFITIVCSLEHPGACT